MHEIPGLTAAQAMAVYELAGRIEITELPSSVTAILDRATNRAILDRSEGFDPSSSVSA